MQKNKGFTLIELVVVVMILGILAAVAAPKLLNTSGTAADNGLKQTLAVVRDAIERYAAEHGGALPGANNSEATFKSDIAPYLRGPFPNSPLTNTDTVKMTSAAGPMSVAASGEAWQYNSADGGFMCNSGATSKSDPTLQYSDF